MRPGRVTVLFPDGFQSPAACCESTATGTWRHWPSGGPTWRRFGVRRGARPGDVLTIAGYGSGSYRAVAGRWTQYVSPGNNQPFEMVELSAAGAEWRLGRAHPQQPRANWPACFWLGLRPDHGQLLRPSALVPGLGRRRFPARDVAGDAGSPTAAAPQPGPRGGDSGSDAGRGSGSRAGGCPGCRAGGNAARRPIGSQVAIRDEPVRSVPMAPVSTSAADLRIGQTLPPPVAAAPVSSRPPRCPAATRSRPFWRQSASSPFSIRYCACWAGPSVEMLVTC